jgi:hypothetical protein
MRNLVVSQVLLAAIALVACGPSSKEVAGAKTARYQGDKLQLFAAAKGAVEAHHKLMKSDETSLGMQTQPRWFSPEGLAQTPRGEGEDVRDLPDKSIKISLVVTLLPDGDAWVVKVAPVMARYNRGIPKPEPLKENDPSLPGWVSGQVDNVAMDIHSAMSKYEVKKVPGVVPAGNTPPPPAPDEPSGSASAQGSAAAQGSAK